MFRHLCRSVFLKKISTRTVSLKPDFTKNKYKVARGDYNKLEERHVDFFRQLLGEHRIVSDPSDLEKYNVDWLVQLRGSGQIVLKPKTTEEVSKILAFCNANRLAVCPQGGNTGISGGANPVFDEIVVSTELMNEVIELDETSGAIVCQAGCVLEVLDNFLAEKGLMMPLDLGAKGSCHIGGNLSTNAGGLRLLRYGNLHGNVLGLEAVKASGEIIDCLSTLKKDNTGYHLKHLFIGSEGTLGIITKVAIQCPAKPRALGLAFLGLQNFGKVLETYQRARHELGEILSAVEVLDTPTMELINEHMKMSSPIGDYPFYLMLETSGSNQRHDSEKLNNFLELALKKFWILNGTVITESTKYKSVWSLREQIAGTYAKDGHVICYDATLPLENYFDIVSETREYTKDIAHRVFGFGHLGDGNLHLQVSIKEFDENIKNDIDAFVYKKVAALKGSISAEHGLGFVKANYLTVAKPDSVVKLMRQMKESMDPNGILNPYKIFPH